MAVDEYINVSVTVFIAKHDADDKLLASFFRRASLLSAMGVTMQCVISLFF